MSIEIIALNDDIKYLYETHPYYHKGDSGLDLYTPENITLAPGDTAVLNFDIKIVTNEKYVILPRSSISKTPIRMIFKKDNLDEIIITNRSNEEYTIAKHQRLFQLCLKNLKPFTYKLIEEKTINLKIKLLSDECKQYYEQKESKCLEVPCIEDLTIPPKSKVLIRLGIKCVAYEGNDNVSYYLYPNLPENLDMSNRVGVIDALYRGELLGSVDNLSEEEYKINKGDVLFHISLPNITKIYYEIVDELDETTRGEGGFGSTGVF